jgi:arsenite/tail-anchored protein-transporting ATPase
MSQQTDFVHPTQYVFFSGKGGVGKSSMAATMAVHKAASGLKTLLVSTDPAGNLGDIFETDISTTKIRVNENLEIIQLDADKITDEYKRKMLAPLEELLEGEALESIKEQFNGGCTVEIATFDRFTDFLSEVGYDVVVFDTAPTGHTLRLMTLPGEWSDYIVKSEQGSGQTCIGPVSQIQAARQKYDIAVNMMRDPERTTMYLVTRPEKTAVYETLRARDELEKTGINQFNLIVNGVYPDDTADSIFGDLRKRQDTYLSILEATGLPVMRVPMQSGEIKGFEVLQRFGRIVFDGKDERIQNSLSEVTRFEGFADAGTLKALVQKTGNRRILAFTGKGGVGKTVSACAAAREVSGLGRTLLITTDPAAHIGQVLQASIGHEPTELSAGLWAANIDQRLAAQEYKDRILGDAQKQGYSEALLESVREELDSPCTEEIAIFERFAAYINDSQWEYIVLDTAPTGHTLRLLELPFDYQKQISLQEQNAVDEASAEAGASKASIEAVINQMKDPATTAFFLVAYPEFTPLHESKRAALDLARVGIQIQGVILNHVLDASDCLGEYAQSRYTMQQHYLHHAADLFDVPLFPLHLLSDEIVGTENVDKLRETLFSNRVLTQTE